MASRKLNVLLLVLLLIPAGVFSDTGAKHQIKQRRPIRLGTSGGNITDHTKKFCCSGTLGALVEDSAGSRYVLSNNHVLAKVNSGKIGQAISQPGLIDSNCFALSSNTVARLSTFVPIQFRAPNVVDAAIAKVIPGKVNRAGRIIDIGRPGPPRQAAIGMAVKKSGRTTGKTFGRIIAVNATVSVEMPRNCGDNNAKNVRFVDQFVIKSTNSRHFIDGGDSGSLVVQRKRTCPATIGLAFAGDDDGNATANRIQNVISLLGVSVVGCSPGTTSSTTGGESASIDSTEKNRFDPGVMHAEAIRTHYEDQLFRVSGVVGIGVGEASETTTDLAIVVFVKKNSITAASSTALPSQLDQIPVRIIRTTGFKAF